MSGPARSCRLDNLVRRLAAFTATVANISTSIRTIISVLAFLTSSLVIPIAVITTKKVSPRRLCKIYQPGQEFQRNTTVTTCHDICTTGQQALVTSSSHTSDGRQRRGVHPWGSGYGRVLMQSFMGLRQKYRGDMHQNDEGECYDRHGCCFHEFWNDRRGWTETGRYPGKINSAVTRGQKQQSGTERCGATTNPA